MTPSDNHWTMTTFSERMPRKDFQALLMGVQPFRFGVICNWKGKHVGAGIYEVRLVPRENEERPQP